LLRAGLHCHPLTDFPSNHQAKSGRVLARCPCAGI
jgi:hypothetical protein